jgi:excisionase family DNA binding protein
MPTHLLTIKEVAEVLRVPLPRAYELAREGVLPIVRLGRQVRIDPIRLEEFVNTGGAPLPEHPPVENRES